MKNNILLFAILLLGFGCKAPSSSTATKSSTYRVGFYNVENLFDLVDNPDKRDDEFTPEGRNKWNQERYDKKLNDISKVIEAMEFPSLMGMCEVENATVLNSLSNTGTLKPHGYQFVHYESPDDRGIDACLMYKQKDFKVLHSEFIRINFPKEIVEDYTTRDILYVKGKFLQKETLHVFVNHWPSRRGGLKESEPKRLYVANQLKKKLTSIRKKNPAAKIIIMGDFNDEPANKSVTEILDACSPDDKKGQLVNCAWHLDQQGFGTYNYRGNWNMLDQIMVSSSLNQKKGLHFTSMQILKQDWMIYNDKKYGPKPNRTYGGPNYYGGISDHYPVFVEFKY